MSSEKIAAVTENQNSNKITKKITFNRETLKNLVTMASREYFDVKMKQDDMLAKMLENIINSYYSEYCKKQLINIK